MSTGNYAVVLRTLFSATYLNRLNSEKTLELLSKTYYKDGIVEGVPSNIPVAHKFGLREAQSVTELHDCGIIYYPDHPYLLCVMTAGSNFNLLQKIIQDISRITYEELDGFFSKSQNK